VTLNNLTDAPAAVRRMPARRPADGAITSLSVVIPCYNEFDNVAHIYREIVSELEDLDLELVFVDDGSTDATLARIKELAAADPRVRFLSFTRNFGFEAAFSAGYRYSSQPWILHLDADLQFPTDQAWVLMAAAEEGYDAVFGVRPDRHDPLVRRLGSAACDVIARRLLKIDLPAGATGFRLVRGDLARRIVDLRLPTPYFLATVPQLTDRYTVVPVHHRPRTRGESTVGLGYLARHAVELFVGFTPRPMAAASGAALLAAFVAVLAALGSAGLLPARAIATVVLVLFAVLLLVVALVARHLVLISAGHARPRQYYVREANLPVDPKDLLCPPVPVTTRVLPPAISG
jgi:polyisoprenyl-phosphate glycosyltransferase